jgi:hypothetical protein
MERLARLAAASSAALVEDLTTAISERYKRRPRATDDVGCGVDQTLATKVREVALLHLGLGVLLPQIRSRYHPKRSCRRKRSHFGSSEVVFVSADSDAFAGLAAGEVQIARQRLSRIDRRATFGKLWGPRPAPSADSWPVAVMVAGIHFTPHA